MATAAAIALLASCGGGDDKQAAAEPEPTQSVASASFQRRFNVGDHKLFLSCRGRGDPTIVYLHGLGGTSANAQGIPGAFTDHYRFCVYDRANMGLSDRTPGRHSGNDSVHDLHRLLDAADVSGPYLLVGASFGGLLAILYAGTYPEEVAGLVLLDAGLPTDSEQDKLIPPSHRRRVIAESENNPERVNLLATTRESQLLEETIRDIPVTYLAAKRAELPPYAPVKEAITLIRRLQRQFIGRFPKGRYVIAESGHFMEAEIPEQVADEIDRVLHRIESR